MMKKMIANLLNKVAVTTAEESSRTECFAGCHRPQAPQELKK